jgi:hypothetical protein
MDMPNLHHHKVACWIFINTTKCLCGIFGTEQSALVVLFVEGFIQGAL